MIIILVRLFYLSVFYLPTKRLAEQYESLSEVIVSFTQMSCYNAYVPLLSKKILDSQYMMLLTQVKQYVPTLAKAIQENLDKMLVNNVKPRLRLQ